MGELPAELTNRVAFLMQVALQRAQEMGEQALAGLDLRGREYGMLALLQSGAPPSQFELGRILGVDRTTTMTLIAGLEARGLVHRGPDPGNRRANRVSLTDAGEELREKAATVLEDCENRFLTDLTPSDVTRLRRILTALSH